MNRAYSILEIKSIDEDKRIITGIASTPTPDRVGDVLEPKGAEFALPLPLLWQHRSDQPVGNVIDAKVSDKGIKITAQFEKVDEPASLKDELDRAWAKVKAKLVRGLSVGFRSLEETFDRERSGFNFLRWEWVELSCVTIPMQSEATIQTIKSADALALSGHTRAVRLTVNPPGVPGPTVRTTMKTIAEQIAALEAKRAANEARMTAIMTKAADEGRTTETAEAEEYDTLNTEVTKIDEDLVRMRAHEKRMLATAQPVTRQNTDDPQKAANTRSSAAPVITVKSNLPKGTTFSRWVMAQVEAKNDKYRAADIAKNWWPDQPEVELILRAAVAAGTTTGTTWASPLVPAATNMLNEFLDLLRPQTIIGRIPGITRVPANVVVPMQTGGGTGNWVGEAAPKPISALAFSSVTLRWAKAIVMTVLSEELIRFSSPNAEAIVRNSLVRDLRQFLDAQFVSTTAAVTNVSPAGILNGATTAAASGTTPAALLTDFRTALATFIAANYDLGNLVILMSSTVAMNISLLRDTQGNVIYPTMSPTGGTILGIPVIVSEAVSNRVIFLNAAEILLADDGGINIDSSNQASILMDDNPAASPQTTALVSLYQRNLVAIKTEQFITWVKARSTSVYYISSASYTG